MPTKIRLTFFSFFAAVLCSLIMLTGPVLAEQINSFQSRVTVNVDGSISVAEYIEYDFGYASRHGIYRYIPFVKKNQEGTKYAMDIKVADVTDEKGQPYTFSTSTSDEKVQIKIGDKDKTVTGVHQYVISYSVKGALTYFNDHDELYWNTTGTEWTVPIFSASTSVKLPPGIKVNEIRSACYTGTYGSSQQNCASEITESVSDIKSDTILLSGEGLTAVVGFPKGIVQVLEPVKYVPFSETLLGRMLTVLLISLIVLLTLWWYVVYPIWIPIKWFLYGRDPTVSGGVTAWYDPPKNKAGRELTPGETGTLVDERVDMNDICATIIDCARRGYIKIVEKKKNDFTFVRLKEIDSDKHLLSFEKELLGGIFGGKKEVRIKDKQMYTVVEATKKKIYTTLTQEEFFPVNPNTQRVYYWAIFGIAMATANVPMLLVVLLFGLSMPRKTLFGKQQAYVAESLRRFLVSQERQLTFQAKEQYWFEKLLPYAVAFGVEKIWAKRFEKMDLTPPDWYEGHSSGHFNSLLFVGAMNNSFNAVRTSSTPPSSTGHSSGFSGGFSGGGGGGGGGGSW